MRVDEQKRTIMLPPALARYRPDEAEFADGELRIHFVRRRSPSGPAQAPRG